MIAEWMLYCVVCSAGLAIAAALAEHALLAGRRQVRHSWIGAVALSLLIPVVAFRFASPPSVAPVAMVATPDIAVDPTSGSALTPPPPIAAPAPTPTRQSSWSTDLARADRPLAVAWLTLSLTLALYLIGGIVALAWLRRSWQRRVVLGVPVLVSERTGPALVGVVSPSIVVPEWSLDMEPTQLALMLRHEQEHRRTGDGQLLTAAQLALIVMPWNIALWWQLMRLRVAVELDCDARVLRDANARSYGDLLLEVARPRRGLRLIGATAFAERATQLERRIRIMARHRHRATRGARTIASSIGLAAVTLAWVAPHPAAPARVLPERVETRALPAAQQQVQPLRTALLDTTIVEASRPMSTPAKNVAVVTDSVPEAHSDTVASPPPEITQRADAAFQRLFDGIALTAEQQTTARAILTGLATAQIAQDQAAIQTTLAIFPKRAALTARRDSALASLITNDADRALFTSRLTASTSGARGRSGLGGPDLLGSRGGRSGGAGLMAGVPAGVRSGGARTLTPPQIPMVVDAIFRRLLGDIALTPEQEASARAVITTTQLDLLRVLPPMQPVRLAANARAGPVLMQSESESALVALLANDADREALQSRITVPVTLIRSAQP